jgi:hypothetical protein
MYPTGLSLRSLINIPEASRLQMIGCYYNDVLRQQLASLLAYHSKGPGLHPNWLKINNICQYNDIHL